MTDAWLADLIIANASFSLHTIDCACFLKCDSEGGSKVMKSECVTPAAPEAVAWDWRMTNGEVQKMEEMSVAARPGEMQIAAP
jgi:hypothetical protein